MTPVEALTQIREFMRIAAKGNGPRNLIPGVLAILDAVSVDATPPQSIDRDALLAVVRANVNRLQGDRVVSDAEVIDRILALVRPVEGVVLSPEEAHEAAEVLGYTSFGTKEFIQRMRALAARLEASS
jgi:hypothetical protein